MADIKPQNLSITTRTACWRSCWQRTRRTAAALVHRRSHSRGAEAPLADAGIRAFPGVQAVLQT